jgi:hypothetical protein
MINDPPTGGTVREEHSPTPPSPFVILSAAKALVVTWQRAFVIDMALLIHPPYCPPTGGTVGELHFPHAPLEAAERAPSSSQQRRAAPLFLALLPSSDS